MATVHPDEDETPPKPVDDFSEGESGDEDDPRAPALDYKDMDKVSGYENANFKEAVSQKPPPAKDLYGDQPAMPFKDISQMKEEEVRATLLKFVDQKFCWGSGPAKNMTMDTIRPLTAFHYVLETYSESRTTKYETVAYPGGFVDGPNCGIAPTAWNITCSPKTLFKNETVLIEVPHTSVIKDCMRCGCKGRIECPRCHGRGNVRCWRCSGSGRIQRHHKGRSRWVNCYPCGGRGRTRCKKCNGDKEVRCPKCEGFKYLRAYIQLQVKFNNYKSDYMLEMTALPDHLVRDVGGDRVFEQEMDRVWPLTSYPVAEINDNSTRLIKKHKDDYAEERCIKQRHHLRAIPVTEVDYTYDGIKKEFWIYGLERKVHCEDYPSQCCCGCTVL